jgi:hypothetical protein
VIWDATGTTVEPALIGDPMGIILFTGHLTIDPTMPNRWFTTNGWWAPLLEIDTYFNGGDTMAEQVTEPFYVAVDPAAPETPSLGPLYRSSCQPHSATHPDILWGNNFVGTSDSIPLSPLAAPWTLNVGTAGYGAQGLPSATFQLRFDLDLHNGIPGRIVQQTVQDGDINPTVTLDPSVIGPGTHKTALFRTQDSQDGTEEVSTLMVFTTTVGDAVTGPPVDCVVTPWSDVSTSTAFSPAITSGSIQTRMVTTTLMQQRTILTPASNGGAACPAN